MQKKILSNFYAVDTYNTEPFHEGINSYLHICLGFPSLWEEVSSSVDTKENLLEKMGTCWLQVGLLKSGSTQYPNLKTWRQCLSTDLCTLLPRLSAKSAIITSTNHSCAASQLSGDQPFWQVCHKLVLYSSQVPLQICCSPFFPASCCANCTQQIREWTTQTGSPCHLCPRLATPVLTEVDHSTTDRSPTSGKYCEEPFLENYFKSGFPYICAHTCAHTLLLSNEWMLILKENYFIANVLPKYNSGTI